jgi:DNA polymerase-3 subunit gamma/tau
MKLQEATSLHTIDEIIQDVQEQVNNPTNLPKISPEPSQPSPKELYQQVILKVKELSFEIGECFEKSFIFNNFSNNKLIIDSKAQGECRKLLYKYFAKIRQIINEIYQKEVEIEFNKTQKENSPKSISEKIAQIAKMNSPQTSSTIEDIEFGSGCINELGAIKSSTPAQKEIDLNDILNSNFIQTAKKLFIEDEKDITIKSKL